MGNMLRKSLAILVFLLILIKPLLGLYYLNVNVKNCENLLVYYEREVSKNISKGLSNIIVNQVCLHFENGEETCYNISISDLMIFVSPEGIRMTDYVVISTDKLPISLTVKDYNGSVICTAKINACIKDGICNTGCSFDPDCEEIRSESIPSNVTIVKVNIKYYDISEIVLIAIAIASIAILLTWWLSKK